MIQLLTNAPAGTVGPIQDVRACGHKLFDANFVVDGDNNADAVEIYASGSSQRNDFRLLFTITSATYHTGGAADTDAVEGPWERVYAKAAIGNAGNVYCFLQLSA